MLKWPVCLPCHECCCCCCYQLRVLLQHSPYPPGQPRHNTLHVADCLTRVTRHTRQHSSLNPAGKIMGHAGSVHVCLCISCEGQPWSLVSWLMAACGDECASHALLHLAGISDHWDRMRCPTRTQKPTRRRCKPGECQPLQQGLKFSPCLEHPTPRIGMFHSTPTQLTLVYVC